MPVSLSLSQWKFGSIICLWPKMNIQPSKFWQKRANRLSHGKSGFTLIELLVVIAIIAILAAIIMPVLEKAKQRALQASCINNLHELGIALTIYADTYNQYPGCLKTANDTYIWPSRLYNSSTMQNRKAFWCPAALPQSAWDTNSNPTLAGPAGTIVKGENNKVDPYAILAGETTPNGSRFSYGYNDWGISLTNSLQLGLGGDIDGGNAKGPVTPTMVRRPSEMIAIGEVRSDTPAGQIQFNANIDPTAANGQGGSNHTQVPCNRHSYHTDLVFVDGHVEAPLRDDVISPFNIGWRARWNNDDDPHTSGPDAIPNWSVPTNGPLEQ